MKSSQYLPVIVLAGAMLFFAYDIAVDLITGLDGLLHISIESVVFVAISMSLAREVQHVRTLALEVDTEKSKNARLAGEMLAVMHGKFEQWGLSGSESEIALLLIKGLSMKEIAEARGVKEKTVRSQAATIYAKSAQAGRHELAAYFLEDLLGGLPASSASSSRNSLEHG